MSNIKHALYAPRSMNIGLCLVAMLADFGRQVTGRAFYFDISCADSDSERVRLACTLSRSFVLIQCRLHNCKEASLSPNRRVRVSGQ